METALHVVAFIAGLVLYVVTVGAVITGMLIPRPRRSRIAHAANLVTNRTIGFWARRTRSFTRRDAILSLVGPLTVLVQLLVFVLLFLVALALMILAVDDLSVASSLYQSGATLLTLGIVEPVNVAQVIITFVAAFTGLAVIAILIGYLLTLYSAYSDRESGLARLSLAAGEPSWGPELLCRNHLLTGSPADGQGSSNQQLTEWVSWIAEIRVTQTGNSVLNHFRSASAYRNWVIGLLALLDAGALELTTLTGRRNSQPLVALLSEGVQTASILAEQALYRTRRLKDFHPNDEGPAALPSSIGPAQRSVAQAMAHDAHRATAFKRAKIGTDTHTPDPGLTQADFEMACNMMAAAGLPVVADRSRAWAEFARLRSTYFADIAVLAEMLDVVNAPWSGPRRPATEVVWPALATQFYAR